MASRLATRVQLTTDGHKAYLEAVEGAFGSEIDYAMLIKLYASSQEETRYSPAECIGCETRRVQGNPDPEHISTSYAERQNLNIRMGMRRFTRLTNAFSKKLDNHKAAVVVQLRTASSDAAGHASDGSRGSATHVWDAEEIARLAK